MIFSNSLVKGALFVNYLVNKDYITEKFCVNKDKPILKCDGKCHLAKQFAKQDKQEKPTSETSKYKFESIEFTAQLPLIELPTFQKEFNTTDSYFAYSVTHSDSHLNETFHPPIITS